MGSEYKPGKQSTVGVIPETIHSIFSRIEASKDWQCTVRVGFVEIHKVGALLCACFLTQYGLYQASSSLQGFVAAHGARICFSSQEEVRDLLIATSGPRPAVSIRESPGGGVCLYGATEMEVRPCACACARAHTHTHTHIHTDFSGGLLRLPYHITLCAMLSPKLLYMQGYPMLTDARICMKIMLKNWFCVNLDAQKRDRGVAVCFSGTLAKGTKFELEWNSDALSLIHISCQTPSGIEHPWQMQSRMKSCLMRPKNIRTQVKYINCGVCWQEQSELRLNAPHTCRTPMGSM
eukprot:1157043-Pelagomonas_calceolata.AAC.3